MPKRRKQQISISNVIFLSHCGVDRELANSVSRTIEKEMKLFYDISVDVFNTSEPEHRFKEFSDIIQLGEDWMQVNKDYEKELAAYLNENLLSSKAYILLVTPESLKSKSHWIEFEMQIADKVARNKKLFYFPCVTKGAQLSKLPGHSKYYQGVDLSSERGYANLIRDLLPAINGKLEDC